MKHFLDWAAPGSREAELARKVDADRLPHHVAVIMDGNGRWAKKRFMPRVAGHRAGIESVRQAIEACSRLGIEALTLYAFSVENWKRPKDEVDTLWGLLRKYLAQEIESFKQNDIRLRVIGRTAGLPDRVRDELDEAVKATAGGESLQLTVALNYGGRSEIVDAVNAAIADARGHSPDFRVDEAGFERYLYTAGLPDPDLLIRTSGEVRVSNFLLWQIAYTEIFVTDKYWPEFRAADLLEAILDYQGRERRFGGLAEAPGQTDLSGLAGRDESSEELVGAAAESKTPDLAPTRGEFPE